MDTTTPDEHVKPRTDEITLELRGGNRYHSTMKKKPKIKDLSIRCLACGRRTRTSEPYRKLNHWPTCEDGVIFHSAGNFGSSVYDADGGEYLQIVVCDKCVRKQASRIRRVFSPYEKMTEADFETFEPPK